MKRFAIIFGVVLLAAGIAGFVPPLTPEGKLLGIFAVDAMHNVVHILTGAIAIGMGMAGDNPARNYFRVFGIVYGLIALMGFFTGHDGELMGMTVNMADHFLHVAISAVALWAGFGMNRHTLPPRERGLTGA